MYLEDRISIEEQRGGIFVKYKKKIIALVCVLAITMLAVPLFAAYANRAVTVTIDGQRVQFSDQGPVMLNNRVLVPVRGVFEHMGFDVSWDYDERVATLEGNGTVVIIPAGSTSFIVDNNIITPDVPQQLINNRMLLPLRAVAEALGGSAEWDNSNRDAMISSPQEPEPTPSPESTPEPTPGTAGEPDDDSGYGTAGTPDGDSGNGNEQTPGEDGQYQNTEPTPEPDDDPYNNQNQQERNPEFVGTWYYHRDVHYIFEYDGTGVFLETYIRWSTYDGQLIICMTPVICGYDCILPDIWDYYITADKLILTSTLSPDVSITYTREPAPDIPWQQEHNHALVGSWYMYGNRFYTFEYNGHGLLLDAPLMWSTYNGRLFVCTTPTICGESCLFPTQWYYNISGETLTLTSTVLDLSLTYTRTPVEPTPTPTPAPTPPQGDDQLHEPFLYTTSQIQLPDRQLTQEERDAWIYEYNSNGGPSAFELEVINLINNIREDHGLNRLQIDTTLMQVTRFYSQTLANLNLPLGGTQGPYGGSIATARSFGVTIDRWNGGNGNGGGWNAAAIVNRWMSSEGHRRYILYPQHNYIGFGSHLGGRFGVFHYLLLNM